MTADNYTRLACALKCLGHPEAEWIARKAAESLSGVVKEFSIFWDADERQVELVGDKIEIIIRVK